MWTKLFIFLCLGSNSYAESIDLGKASISTSTSSSNSSSDSIPLSSLLIEEELTKIATTCLSREDLETLTGKTLKYYLASFLIYPLITQSCEIIGLQELRIALKLPRLSPWKPFNRTDPSEQELASAFTIGEYYNLKEPRSEERSLDSDYFFESTIATAVAFLDKRMPSIRTVFRRKFEEAGRVAPEVLDKEKIDSMIVIYDATVREMRKPIESLMSDSRCRRYGE